MTPIHLFWHTSVLPDHVELARDAWTSARVWTPDDAPSGALALAEGTASRVHVEDHPRHLANVVRWHLLRDYGGIWADTDVTPLLPLDPLFGPMPFCASVGSKLLETAVIGGPANHDLWHRLIAAIATETHADRGPNVSGAKLLRRIALPGEIIVHEPGRFFDRDSYGGPIPEPRQGPRYATHAWVTSSQRMRATT